MNRPPPPPLFFLLLLLSSSRLLLSYRKAAAPPPFLFSSLRFPHNVQVFLLSAQRSSPPRTGRRKLGWRCSGGVRAQTDTRFCTNNSRNSHALRGSFFFFFFSAWCVHVGRHRFFFFFFPSSLLPFSLSLLVARSCCEFSAVLCTHMYFFFFLSWIPKDLQSKR